MRRILVLFTLAASGALAAIATEKPPAGPQSELADGLYAEFTTPRGVFVAQLFYDKTPLTCGSFVGLAEGRIAPRDGKPFFTGLRWYRVVPNFVIQSGDPDHDRNADKEDAGHPYTFPDEFVPGLHHDAAGVLSMANAGPDTNSCEFFLTLRDTNRLNYLHSVFGRVVRGVEVLPQIRQDDAFSIKILRVGAAARAFDAGQAAFDVRRAAAKKYAGAPEPGPAAHFDDPDRLLPQEVPRAKNFNFKLANFERVTGKKIYARLFAQSPPADADKVPGAWMHALAKKLGTAGDGVLAVYFADEKDWRVWIGDDVVSVFLGRLPTRENLTEGAALHKAKTAFIDAALAQGDAEFAAQQKAAPADQQPTPAQHLKLQTDALLDGLIFKLEQTK
jgi:cyclophilin family peptidyl-prolyl cis-trans isomerase